MNSAQRSAPYVKQTTHRLSFTKMASAVYIKLRITFAVIGIFVGLSIFLCFAFAYNNWDVAVWGLFSGVFAGATLLVHIKYTYDKWMTSAYQLKHLMLCGCLVQLAAICGFVAYMTIAINEGQALTPYGPRAYYLTTVWCFMTWKWGFGLFYYSRDYKRRYEEETGQFTSAGKYEQI